VLEVMIAILLREASLKRRACAGGGFADNSA
jgi:hypothetical protein